MLITSHLFLFYFFPIFIALYYFIYKRITFANILIILASLVFYASFGLENLPILVIPLVFDYILGIVLFKTKKKTHRKLLLTFGIIANLAVLIYFKYSSFVGTNLLTFFPNTVFLQELSVKLIAPIGISFITFQRISYIVDIYRKKVTPAKNFLHYATYACLFPHLLAGPIVRFSTIKNQLKKRVINRETVFEASKYFTVGLAVKLLIADQLFTVEELFTTSLATNTLYEAILLILFFSFRIYMDFFGYSLMAIGLAKFMGFDFPINFNSPYQSTSITDFWRRWNITLSNWLRDYLYIPLGGNRKGKIRTYVNLFITMFLAGLWHGASWNFVIWGSLHGVFLIIERLFINRGVIFPLARVFKIIYAFILVTITWISFKFTTIPDLLSYFASFSRVNFVPFTQYEQNIIFATIPALLVAIIWSFFIKDQNFYALKASKKLVFFFAILFIISLCSSLIRKSVPFIYFQF